MHLTTPLTSEAEATEPETTGVERPKISRARLTYVAPLLCLRRLWIQFIIIAIQN